MDEDGIHQLTKTYNETEHENEDTMVPSQEESDTTNSTAAIVGCTVVFMCVLTCVAIYTVAEPYKRYRIARLNRNPSLYIRIIITH